MLAAPEQRRHLHCLPLAPRSRKPWPSAIAPGPASRWRRHDRRPHNMRSLPGSGTAFVRPRTDAANPRGQPVRGRVRARPPRRPRTPWGRGPSMAATMFDDREAIRVSDRPGGIAARGVRDGVMHANRPSPRLRPPSPPRRVRAGHPPATRSGPGRARGASAPSPPARHFTTMRPSVVGSKPAPCAAMCSAVTSARSGPKS